jgi:hypothetical protein
MKGLGVIASVSMKAEPDLGGKQQYRQLALSTVTYNRYQQLTSAQVKGVTTNVVATSV